MIVLHGGFYKNQFLMWAESSDNSLKEAAAKREPSRLPFAASAAVLEEVQGTLGIKGKHEEEMVLWVPTARGVPHPSSTMIAELPGASHVKLSPWTIPVLSLERSSVLELLSSAFNKRVLATGLAVGRDMAFWSKALRFAASLASRERFLPGIISSGSCFKARWEPVFQGEDAHFFGRLAAAIPGVCCAFSEDAAHPPEISGAGVLSSFLTEMVDAVVRAAYGIKPETGELRSRASFESIHDYWLSALTETPDGVMDGCINELAQLADEVRKWRRSVEITTRAPFRLTFRLEEPGGEEGWYLRYLLQSVEDPSLLVAAEEVWSGDGRELSALSRYGFNPREFLLVSLGQAAVFDPGIEESLRVPAPTGCQLDTHSAYRFLSKTAPLLYQAGFSVMLPNWWSGRGSGDRLSLRANARSPRMQGRAGLNLSNLVEVDWEAALGGDSISLAELEELAKLKVPLVKWRGKWVRVSEEEIRKALNFLKDGAPERMSARELLRLEVGAERKEGSLEFAGVKAAGWLGEVLAKLKCKAPDKDAATPQGFSGTLRPYQRRGFTWLLFLEQCGLGACLADDMGLGKTVQALALLQAKREAGIDRPSLLVCPTSVIENWFREARRFTPGLQVKVHHGPDRDKGQAFVKEAADSALVITSYPLVYRDIAFLRKRQLVRSNPG